MPKIRVSAAQKARMKKMRDTAPGAGAYKHSDRAKKVKKRVSQEQPRQRQKIDDVGNARIVWHKNKKRDGQNYAEGRMKKFGKLLNTDVKDLGKMAKRGLAKRKVRKMRADKKAAKVAGAIRKNSGVTSKARQAAIKRDIDKLGAKKAGKKIRKDTQSRLKKAGMTKGLAKAERRAYASDNKRSAARKARQADIAKRKKSERVEAAIAKHAGGRKMKRAAAAAEARRKGIPYKKGRVIKVTEK